MREAVFNTAVLIGAAVSLAIAAGLLAQARRRWPSAMRFSLACVIVAWALAAAVLGINGDFKGFSPDISCAGPPAENC